LPGLLLICHSTSSTNDATSKEDDRQKSLSAFFRVKLRSGQKWSINKRFEPRAEVQPGVFGVPLKTSITYANVAISLSNDKGESYIYGYIPIVVARNGALLKEDGE